MPPSTVFSYLRREHRRSSASPTAPSTLPAAKGNSTSSPPQLPAIANAPPLATTTAGSLTLPDVYTTSPLHESSPDLDVTTSNLNAPLSSSVTLAVPSSSSDQTSRPHSSSEVQEQASAITSQSNHSQQSFTNLRQDPADVDYHKPSSPFRLSLGRGRLNVPTQSPDGHKRSPTPGGASASQSRLKTFPEDNSGDRGPMLQRDHKSDNAVTRRSADRDASTDNAHHRTGKTRLHLLNPMSLLARRRSSQMVSARTEDGNIGVHNLVPAIPDDYDPRIRGNIVHDFSAPRPRRNFTTPPVLLQDATHQLPGQGLSHTGNGPRAAEQRKRHSEYSPVFKEHFEDDEKALQVENKGYLHSSLLTNQSHDEQAVPVFARRLPLRLPDKIEEPREQTVVLEEPLPVPTDKGSPTGNRDPDVVENHSHPPIGLPKHLKSNASRFSFDMNGVGSSVQEKLLEEKHKEKEAARRAQAQLDGEFSDFDDDFDDDMLDEVDDFEEKIPGVNVDADEDDFSGFSGPGAVLNGSLFVPGLSPVVASPISPAYSNLAQNLAPQESDISRSYSPSIYENSTPEDELNVQSREAVGVKPPMKTQPSKSIEPVMSEPLDDDDDDLYFDDGEFGDLTADPEGSTFDESIFDDETSHLYDRKRATAPPVVPEEPEEETVPDVTLQASSQITDDPANNPGLEHVPSMASEFKNAVPGSIYRNPSERIPNVNPSGIHDGVLSEHNLEALHYALERAANDAAALGRFEQTPSVSERSMGQESVARTTQTADSHPGLISDDSRLSQAADALGFDDAFDDFNYDDDEFYDDPIIAAANAEALENDDEGFYGQEFGFYAQAHGSCNSELTNGGYFGPRGIESISRSFSSRGKFCEPSLTPITERSEWSTRNSVISLTAHGAAHSNPSLSSPGLAQLVDMGSIDDEMSLSALLKLRRGAWGGSNGSLRSSAGSPPPNPASNRGSITGLHDMSPIVAECRPLPADAQQCTEQSSPEHEGQRSGSKTGTSKSHSRTSSSASISYSRETDEDGSRKWVLERRRPSEDGETGLCEREVLTQGRI